MKKITSILLFVAMILTVAVMSVSAAGTDGSLTVVANKTQVEVNEEVTLTVKADAKTAVGSIDFHLVLPEGVDFVAGSGKVLVTNSQFMMSAFTEGELYFGCGMTMTGVTGTFDVLEFKVKATKNGEFNVGISVSEASEGIGNVVGDGKLDFSANAAAITAHTCAFDQENTDAKFLKSAADCTNAAVYYKSCACGKKGAETFVSGAANGHKMTKTAAKEATCTAPGNKEYYTCSACTKLFEDEAGTKATTTDAVKIAQLNHTFDKEVQDAKFLKNDADCVNAKTYFKSCTCGEKGTETFTVGEALGHKLTKVEEKAATCQEKGNEEHYACDVCKKLFDDENGVKEVAPEFVSIAQKKHSYEEKKLNVTENGHNYLCDMCDQPANELAPHVDNDGDNKCDDCQYDIPAAPSSSVAPSSSAAPASSSVAPSSSVAGSSTAATVAPSSAAASTEKKPAATNSHSPVTSDGMTLWTMFALIAVLTSVVGIVSVRKTGK